MTATDDEPTRYDFICSTNEDFKRLITILKEDGTPQSVVGWSGYLYVYESWEAKISGDDPILAITPSTGMEILSEDDGQFLATLLQDDIGVTVTGSPHGGNFAPRKTCIYDGVFVDADGIKMRQLAGNFIFELGISTVTASA